MKRWIVLFLGFSSSLYAANFTPDFACTAQVTNRVFNVEMETATRAMKVTNDLGFIYEGIASNVYSPRANSNTYYLPTGYSSGFELEVELAGQQRVAFCLRMNECYLCRRR